MYEYRAKVLKVHDGDTIRVEADLGFDVRHILNVRFYGINTPELRGEELEAGLVARDWLRTQLPEGSSVVLKTYKDRREKFGRYLAEVYCDALGDESLNDALVRLGLAERI